MFLGFEALLGFARFGFGISHRFHTSYDLVVGTFDRCGVSHPKRFLCVGNKLLEGQGKESLRGLHPLDSFPV